ncbi:hypothetical protein EGR_07967 [Echinococcus granulosus]|uniref:Uncharacterized protein n=1 Tax=Echinococcus granulosus TaxID=6210 RepID=W6U7K2_ECHGR|nr:hypothetical protein EGR_07967 [Echinococcus granulosus]EUB57150.1 hypothetical protein EGR_07967 [Echinococcus granulosus]
MNAPSKRRIWSILLEHQGSRHDSKCPASAITLPVSRERQQFEFVSGEKVLSPKFEVYFIVPFMTVVRRPCGSH